MKKLTILIALLMASSAWAEPDKFIRQWGMENNVSHLTWGLEKCSNFLEDRDFYCTFNYDENLVYVKRSQYDFVPSELNLTKDDYQKVSDICGAPGFLPRELYSHLKGNSYVSMATFFLGFVPQGYSFNLPDGKLLGESMEDWLVKNTVVQYFVIGEEGDAWRCEWKASEGVTASVRYFTKEQHRKYRARND